MRVRPIAQPGADRQPARSRRASSIRSARPASRRRRSGRVAARGATRHRRQTKSPRRRRPRRADRRRDPRAAPTRSNFANSDLAFSGEHLFVGNFHGFNTYDIEQPNKPKLVASVVCPGGQGDVSVHGTSAGHVGRADARPHRLRHCRACRTRSAPSASAASASSTSPISRSRSRWPPCRPAAARTRTRS